MREYYYYRSIRKSIIMFLDVFKNVQIARHDSGGTITGYKKVPLKLGLKEKVWYWLHEKKDDEILPMMSVVLSSVEYDANRQTNKMRSVVKSTTHSSGEIYRFLNPIPYNLGFTMTLWSLFMVDVDQILEQILPYFTPTIFVHINIPELDAILDLKVLFNGCSPDVSLELPDEDVRVIKWNLDFMVQTYLFQPLKTSDIIHKVIDKIYTNDNAWGHRFTESSFTSGAAPDNYEAEAIYTKGIPPYFDEDDWVASTSYDVGDFVKPTTDNGYLYEAQNILLPGHSGTTEPTWPTTKGTPVVDNDVIWERYQRDEFIRLTEWEVFS